MNANRLQPEEGRSDFLHELRRECDRRLDPETTNAVVTELADHLHAAIQARMELGQSQSDAEHDAVNSLGSTQKIARSLHRIHSSETRHDPLLFAFGLSHIALMTANIEGCWFKTTWWVMPAALIALLVCIALRSLMMTKFRVRTLRLLAVCSVIGVGLISPLLTINLWSYGGMGYCPAQMAQALANDPQKFIDSQIPKEDPDPWVVQFEVNNVEPAKRSVAAPVLERYPTNLSQTIPLLGTTLIFVTFAHLGPVALRRRLRSRRAKRAIAKG